MIIPGCCSQSLPCSHWNSVATGWGRVAHSLSSGLIASVVLWMLWGAAGLVRLLSRAGHVEHGLKLLAKLICEEEEEESFLSITLSVVCPPSSVHLTVILLFSDYLTHVFTCHLFKHVCVLRHSCFQLVCEIAAAGKGIPPVGLNLAWDMFAPNTTSVCNGSSASLETLKKMTTTPYSAEMWCAAGIGTRSFVWQIWLNFTLYNTVTTVT